MIEASQMIPLLIDASPSFAKVWEDLQKEWAGEPDLPDYVVLGDFARHMCSLLSEGDEETLMRIFVVIERLHTEGNRYVREAATVGLLEDLQNTNLHIKNTSPEQFKRFLLPESCRFWAKLYAFWNEGKIITDD